MNAWVIALFVGAFFIGFAGYACMKVGADSERDYFEEMDNGNGQRKIDQ